MGLMMLMLAVLCLCGSAMAECEYGHTPVTVTVTPATCEHDGLTRTTCAVCGTHLYDTTVYKVAHNWSAWSRVTEPTCEKEGRDERHCTMCGRTEERAVAKVSHTKADQVITPPDCVNKGLKNIVCSVCGTMIQSNVSMPAKGHSWSGWTVTKSATCTENGEKQRGCESCGKTETAQVKATGHSMGAWVTKTPAGCVTKGEQEQTCANCGYSKTRELKALGHQWGKWTAVIKETCTTAGEYKRVCARCAGEESKTVAALNHKNTVWKTVKAATTMSGGMEEQYCRDCGIYLKSRATSPALMKNNTMCALGICLRDAGVEGDLWYMFTPFDASKDGVYTYPLVASNLFTVGTVTLNIRDGKAAVNYHVDDPELKMVTEFFTILPSIDAIRVYEPEELKAAYGMNAGQWIDLKAFFGEDEALVLYMNCRVTYTYNAKYMTTLRYESESIQRRVDEMKALMD